jgi:hypothetical protein
MNADEQGVSWRLGGESGLVALATLIQPTQTICVHLRSSAVNLLLPFWIPAFAGMTK